MDDSDAHKESKLYGDGSQFSRFPEAVIDSAKRMPPELAIDYSLFATMGETTEYSSLLPYQLPQVVEYCRARGVAGCDLLVDATAHVGCDSVNFAKNLGMREVVAIERDPVTYAALCSNVEAFDLGGVVRPTCADALDYLRAALPAGAGAVVYFDPPWGGRDYWRQKKMTLRFDRLDKRDGQHAEDVCDVAAELLRGGRAKMVVVKVPTNFDHDRLRATLAADRFEINTHTIRKPLNAKASGGEGGGGNNASSRGGNNAISRGGNNASSRGGNNAISRGGNNASSRGGNNASSRGGNNASNRSSNNASGRSGGGKSKGRAPRKSRPKFSLVFISAVGDVNDTK